MKISSRGRVLSGALVFSLAAFAPSVGRAQAPANSAAAQGLFDQAKALMAAGKPAEACPKFEESQRLDPGSGTLINLASCYEQTGRIASAWSTYLEAAVASRAVGNFEREAGARERAAALAPKVSNLVVAVPPEARVEGLRIIRDGVEVGAAQWGLPIPCDEGSHEIIATAPGRAEWRSNVTVQGQGTTATLQIPVLLEIEPAPAAAEPLVPSAAPSPPSAARSLTAAPAEPASPGLGGQRIAAIALAGAGVAGLAVGTIFGLQAMSHKDDADAVCGSGGGCSTQAGVSAGEDARSAGNLSTVGMIVGGVALAGGAVLWFTAPEQPSTEIGVGLGGVTLRSVF